MISNNPSDPSRSDHQNEPVPSLDSNNQQVKLVEVAPELLELHHKETVSCFLVDPKTGKVAVSRPKIELGRGIRLGVDGEAALQVGKRSYLKIVQCADQPEAVGLYLRQSDVLDVPKGITSFPAAAIGKLNLGRIKRANKAGKPIMDISGVRLAEGTVFRISIVHRVTGADKGDGIIDADGSVDFQLLIECPQNPEARGLFAPVGTFQPVTEDVYAKITARNQSPDGGKQQEMAVTVAPKDGGSSVFLFKDMSQVGGKRSAANKKGKKDELPIEKSPTDSLPAGTQLIVSSSLTVSSEKEYYLILECPPNPGCKGLYILAKEISAFDAP